MNRRKTVDLASQQFYKFEKWLLAEKSLKKLSPTSKILYMVLRDREELSLKNAKAFTDKDGFLFQYFDQEKASELIGVSLTAIKKAFKDLIEYKLIESARQGQGKPNRIYVLEYEVSEDTIKELSYENKKAPTVAPVEAEEVKNNNSNKSICNSTTNYTPVPNKNIQENNTSEVVQMLKEKGFKNINEKQANETFTDMSKLRKCIERVGDIKQYKYLHTTYIDFKEASIKPKDVPTVKTRFHNINESFSKYSPDELEKILQESQRDKFK